MSGREPAVAAGLMRKPAARKNCTTTRRCAFFTREVLFRTHKSVKPSRVGKALREVYGNLLAHICATSAGSFLSPNPLPSA